MATIPPPFLALDTNRITKKNCNYTTLCQFEVPRGYSLVGDFYTKNKIPIPSDDYLLTGDPGEKIIGVPGVKALYVLDMPKYCTKPIGFENIGVGNNFPSPRSYLPPDYYIPIPPKGYMALGIVESYNPDINKYRCVKADLITYINEPAKELTKLDETNVKGTILKNSFFDICSAKTNKYCLEKYFLIDPNQIKFSTDTMKHSYSVGYDFLSRKYLN
jgi:hypothetical protein